MLQSKAAPAARTALSLASLPDDLLLRCLDSLSQEARFGSVALVSKHFQQLCLAPQLLRRLDMRIHAGASVLPRSAALLQFLAAHAAHVQELELDVDPEAYGDNEDAVQLSDSQQQELAANVASSLALCAAGSLRRLTISEMTPLHSTAWLPALRHLDVLRLGSVERSLRLPVAVSRLTALADATLQGSLLVLEGPLPPGLTRLQIYDVTSEELPRQVSQLSALATLQLGHCKYQAASMACLSALTTLRRLEVTHATALPPTLPAMTWLECLHTGPADSMSEAEHEAWRQTEAAALPQLTRLTTLVLDSRSELESTLTAIAQLPRLERLRLDSSSSAALPSPAALSGPWLASLCWLGLPWDCLERAVDALHAAPRLEYVCSLSMPACTDIDDEPWLAAWDFLATHPPLRCFGIDSNEPPDLPMLDAVMCLHNRRPALQTKRPYYLFSIELLNYDEILPLMCL